MSNEPFFKSQADIHAWLNEERGVRKVRQSGFVVGYNTDGILWNYTNDTPWASTFIAEYWQPVPATVPWYERPEAIGALVLANDDGVNTYIDTFVECMRGREAAYKGRYGDWSNARPLTPDEVRELLAKAVVLDES